MAMWQGLIIIVHVTNSHINIKDELGNEHHSYMLYNICCVGEDN